jgi:hypothetical protein
MELTGLAAAQPSLLATRRGKLILVLLCSVAFLDYVGPRGPGGSWMSSAVRAGQATGSWPGMTR